MHRYAPKCKSMGLMHCQRVCIPGHRHAYHLAARSCPMVSESQTSLFSPQDYLFDECPGRLVFREWIRLRLQRLRD